MKIVVGFLLLVLLTLGLAAGCSRIPSEDRAVRAAENLGLTHVRVVSRRYAWGVLGGCKDDDLTLFHLVGTTADGSVRKIDVCAPLVGGYTVRS